MVSDLALSVQVREDSRLAYMTDLKNYALTDPDATRALDACQVTARLVETEEEGVAVETTRGRADDTLGTPPPMLLVVTAHMGERALSLAVSRQCEGTPLMASMRYTSSLGSRSRALSISWNPGDGSTDCVDKLTRSMDKYVTESTQTSNVTYPFEHIGYLCALTSNLHERLEGMSATTPAGVEQTQAKHAFVNIASTAALPSIAKLHELGFATLLRKPTAAHGVSPRVAGLVSSGHTSAGR